MRQSAQYGLVTVALLFMLTACATINPRKVAKTPISNAKSEIPEEELLDVGITVFKSSEVTEKKAKKERTTTEVRTAEGHFIPYHLKNTLEHSGYWGMVKVTPLESETADVLVQGKIIESNGENLTLKVTVRDSRGKVWINKTYKATVTGDAYGNNSVGEKDAFQGIYNAIANDMSRHMETLNREEIKNIRTVSKLKFAREFAPQPFEAYLKEEKGGEVTLTRLPADDDPMMERILRIRERDYMFEDTLNEYYEEFYHEMWSSYEDWRTLNLTERVALAEQKRDAFLRQAGGALLVALAILLEVQDAHDSGILTGALVIIGGQVFLSGVNITKQAQIHYEALAELGESFGSEVKPIVVEFQDKKYELTGSAEEQYTRWRELLRQIYYAETGFRPPDITDRNKPQEQ